jgi:PucR C-terminal helix-turn-helix domain
MIADPVPPETIAAVRPALPRLVQAVIEAVSAENAIYAAVLAAPEGIGIRLGIEQAIRSFLDAIERGEPPAGETSEMWRRLGEAEFQAGRGLETLRAAFRTGTRAAWRGAADIAAEAGVPAPIVISLAEAIFVFSDELAADVVEGYLRMQSDEAGERERRRRRLATLLVDPDGADPEAVERTAELARWPIPRRLAVLALGSETPGPIVRSLDVEVLVGSDPVGAWLVLPDPGGPGRATALRRAAAGTVCALGPTVAPRDAARSLKWARRTLDLVKRGALPNTAPTHADDHLGTVMLLADGEMANAFASERLAPLDQLSAIERDRLLATLESWLAYQRHTPKIAAELHVHPQTVRYRVGRLRELLGERLASADGRFELQMALRIRRASAYADASPATSETRLPSARLTS